MRTSKKFVFIVLGSLLGAFLFEGSLRILGYCGFPTVLIKEEDDLLGWKAKPGAKGVWHSECFKTFITINSQGFRDREHTIRKSRGVFRIAIIGDSHVEALQVPLEKTFWSVLQRQLDRLREGKYEVLAFGVAGFGTTQEYLMLKRDVLPYSPDLIILMFTNNNDIRDASFRMTNAIHRQYGGTVLRTPYMVKEGKRFDLVYHTPRKSFFDRAVKPVLRSLAIFQVLRKFKTTILRKNPGLLGGDGASTVPEDSKVYMDPSPPEVIEAWEVIRYVIRQMKESSLDSHSRFAVVIIPGNEEVYPKIWKESLKPYTIANTVHWDLNKPNTLMEEFLKDEGIPALALSPIFKVKSTTGVLPFSPCDAHWNEIGHQWVGEALAEYLVKRRLINSETN